MIANKFQEILDSITPEEKAEFERETLEFLAKERWLEEQGYVYNTDKSYSLKLLNDGGFFPIGICSYCGEETFIWRTKKEANQAWKSRVLGWDGYFYSKKDFEKEVVTDEYFNGKVIWL